MSLTKAQLKTIFVTNRKLTQENYWDLFDSIVFLTEASSGNADYLHTHSISGVTYLPQTLALKADLVDGKVPSSQLPSYVDDVVEFATFTSFPISGEPDKIYVAVDSALTYRWSGSIYIEISKSLALGTTSGTAYYGDKGEIAYLHSQEISGNPHNTQISDIPNLTYTLNQLSNEITNSVSGSIVEHTLTYDHTKLHDSLTVSNSSSISLTLVNQALSANAVFGLTSNTIAEGNHTHPVSGIEGIGDTLLKLSTYTKITESTSGSAGTKYIANTVSGSFELYLPQGIEGDSIEVWDYYGTWDTNVLTLVPFSGDKIDGLQENMFLDVSNARVILVFTDSNRGWQIDVGGNFVGNGTSGGGNSYYTKIDYSITASNNGKYIANTQAGAFPIFLPVGVEGDLINIWDYYGSWGTNNLTIVPSSGEKIGGVIGNLVLDTNNSKIELLYTDSNRGWQVDIGGIPIFNQPASQIINDSTVSGVNVKNALEELQSIIVALTARVTALENP